MQGVLSAKTAVLVHFKSVGAVLLVLGCIVISLLALGACQCDFCLHINSPHYLYSKSRALVNTNKTPFQRYLIYYHTFCKLSRKNLKNIDKKRHKMRIYKILWSMK